MQHICCGRGPYVLASREPTEVSKPQRPCRIGICTKRLGPERILLVLDPATGRPEDLPFDLRGNRVIAYGEPAATEDSVESDLTAEFTRSLKGNGTRSCAVRATQDLVLSFFTASHFAGATVSSRRTETRPVNSRRVRAFRGA